MPFRASRAKPRAAIAYLGYALFAIPSNLYLERAGARKTFARITILWGLTSVAAMFVKTAASFFIVHFLLGCFEAGLLPGVVLYMTYWFNAFANAPDIDVMRSTRELDRGRSTSECHVSARKLRPKMTTLSRG